MIPQVAHPPRQLAQPFGNSAFAASPFEPLHVGDPRGSSQRAPLPFRSPRNASIPPTSVRSYHTENHTSQNILSSQSSSQTFAGQYNDSAEHMLRRKTPSGTLAAGYDGTPIQWSGKVPALKHVVLPMSAVPSNHQVASSSTTPIEHQARQRSSSVGWNGHRGIGSGSGNGSMRMNSDPGNWTYFPLPSNPPSNVLDHLSMQQATTFYPNNGMQIPTVIQPGYQASPGPTASNDAGLYGPYWPDGKFVPYRPAAYRGHERQHLAFGLDLNGGFQQQVNPPIEMVSPFGQAPYSLNSNPQIRRPSFLSIETGSNMSDPAFMIANQHGPQQLANDLTSPNLYMSPADGSRTPTSQARNRPSSNHFKEKTLSWAHSIYVDLLAFLHQSRKDSRQSRNSQGFRPKATIYPKPPRQPASSFGASGWSQSFVPTSSTETNGVRQHVDTAFPSGRRSSANGFGAWHGSADFGEGRYSRFSNQDMPHYVSPFHSSSRATDPPLSKAREALEVLTSLCEQSGWLWIDGMLLGGCLAYGLEEYHKALDWYSKILALDTKHVEAMSNLAATLLCLNRREEAEQHWLQSVKLRPNYFEAVEHLIGLLCGDHRSTEAVNIIEFVERSLRLPKQTDESHDYFSETSSNADRESCGSFSVSSDKMALDYDGDDKAIRSPRARDIDDGSTQAGYGSSGFSVPGSDNGRILALIHAKGNMLYALGDIDGASKAFEDAVLISAGRTQHGVQRLIKDIISVLSADSLSHSSPVNRSPMQGSPPPLLLPPDKALRTAKLVFAKSGELPGLRHVPEGLAKRAAVSTTSNSLLSLAKIFQDSMSNSNCSQKLSRMPRGVGDILALYYLSLSLQPSPSTANNVGILLASVQQPASHRSVMPRDVSSHPSIPGVVPGSGVALALAYYNYGLNLDSRHAHLYTNLGSLLKDIGQLNAAIKMYEQAVNCDGSFDIALANLANAVKDQGRTNEAIAYYRRAVASSPDFAEAVCGLANALNSVCDWTGRGGVILDGGRQDRWHVDESGMITRANNGNGSGWMKRVVDIVSKQLKDGASWGRGALRDQAFHQLLQQVEMADTGSRWEPEKRASFHATLGSWAGHRWEGARVLRLVERAIKRALHRWYHDKHVRKKQLPASCYPRPRLPSSLTVPSAPTVLPFHTFTCPLSAKDIRMISQRNAFRISCSTLKAPWMQGPIFPPPSPPAPHLNIGYVSSDFNNHPLAHLMQSVFGLHDPSRAKAFCYATTASDNSIHRQQIEREAPVFRDVNTWSADRLVQQIVQDEIHILVNLNGYTRGARNEVFAARPAPIQMSFMGFAGTLGAEWCDYLLADTTAIPPDTLRPWRRNVDLEDQLTDQRSLEDDDWVYSENIIFCRDTFFCCDHAKSESRESQVSWEEEQSKRWDMRKQLFPSLADDAIILGNFNQLYKIEPTTFRTWLRILDKVPKAILWLLRFPDLGETNLKRTAREWAGESVASRIWFTDVAPKHQHISRARVCDLFLDTPECNAHTTAADVLWSSTPLLTLPRYNYKMCSRMAASILKGALPKSEEGRRAASELIAEDDEQYEEFAIKLASGLSYRINSSGRGEGVGRLSELRKLLYDSRWTCALFDTKRWVTDLESAYEEAWRRWVANDGGDIYL